ncbi:hypothetical protein LJC68_04880 [Bacteroidales bacterium OttesenSCG-928-B11]|nr:hypothetical protein [Bacteroidales bacterium OttesenSCG-928-E04]MDL2309082.1 hypothetical protein [Bacteroidales bacterium OttesenSCG-928-C03]MDL2312191.1 hypothetical protein [Bacteroidales bacterium OttesenSCG-928-B11]MDL2326241.1 hypothetical protein [Bacteroidales bacterium OttesenSCG-928-A14]
MKRINLLVVTLCLICSVSVSAQKPFAGHVKSEIRIEGTDDVNITANFPMETSSTIMGNKSMTKMDFNGIGQLIIQNGDKSQMTFMMDLTALGMDMYYITKTINPPKTKEYKYVTDKSDTKTILGYNCYKVTCTMLDLEDDEETITIYYISDDFMPGFKHVGDPQFVGYPLLTIQEVSDATSSYKVITEAKEIKADKKVKDATFLLPSSAKPYTEAPEEIQEAFSGFDDM